jgi:hypothetical protein
MNLLINKTQAAKEWIEKLDINTSSLYLYKTNLEAFINFAINWNIFETA